MRCNAYALSAAAVVALALTAVAAAEEASLPLEKRTYTDRKGKSLGYRLLKPKDYDPGMKYALVLFLHGAGERGDDNQKQLVHGVKEFAKAANRKKYPCFLVAPQCPEHDKWSNVDWGGQDVVFAKRPNEPMRLALELMDQLQKEFAVDARRIYITGLSMGGFGTWDAICRRPDYFAAAVPVCGGADDKQARRIAKIPIWVFHGAKDQAVNVNQSRKMIAALKKVGGKPRYTEYPDEDHFSWVPAYKDAEMFAWLFGQKRK